MRIALCLEFPLGLQGGVSVLVRALAEGLRGKYELVLVSPDAEKDFAMANAGSLFSEQIFWEPEKNGAATSQRLAEQLARSGVRLAHFHGGTFSWGSRFPRGCPIPYTRRRGIRVCTTTHLVGDWLDGFCGPQKPLWFKLLLLPVATLAKLQVLTSCDCEICVSRHDYNRLVHRYWPLRRRFAQIYHSRVRAGSLQPGPATRRKAVLCVGHLARRKGQHILARAFGKVAADFPDWELWLAGPALEQHIASEIQNLAVAANTKDRVKLLGDRLDAMELMRQAAIYVQPSLVEPLGLALQEAMFAGCACAGSSVGGIPELIENDSVGVLVPPGDADALASQLRRWMQSPAERNSVGRAAAYAMAERGMTWENMIRQHLKLYETLLRR